MHFHSIHSENINSGACSALNYASLKSRGGDTEVFAAQVFIRQWKATLHMIDNFRKINEFK